MKTITKTTAAILIIAILLGGMGGCTNNAATIDPIETTRPLEEIEKTGITPEDVLAAFDELARDTFRGKYGIKELRESLYYDLDAFVVQFDRISPFEFGNRPNNWTLPYFYIEDDPDGFTPFHSWLSLPDSIFYNPNIQPFHDVYTVTLNATVCVANKSDNFQVDLTIPKDAMEKVFAAYGLKSYTMTKEKAKELDERARVISLTKIDETVYEPLTIDRVVIAESTEEQLWAIYNLLRPIYSIDFYGEYPQEGKDYSVEIE